MESKIIEFKGMPLFQKATFQPPFVMQGTLKDFACFFYMLEGTMKSYDARGVHQISDKEAITKSCGSYVQKYVNSDESGKCEAIAIYLYPELLKEIYKNEVPGFLSGATVQKPKKLIGNKLIEQYMSNLVVFFEEPEAIDEELGILKLKELIMILLRSENHNNIQQLLSDFFAPVNVKFKTAIEQNIFNPLSLEELAFICNMSLSTFKREFKKEYGETPARYIKERRLDHAASLIACGNDSITSISFDSGFQDITTFSDSFQKKYGLSPSKYRLTFLGK
ncbi:MAG: AraC family transcriptional regulator [Crocinitomicaceae bacterium]